MSRRVSVWHRHVPEGRHVSPLMLTDSGGGIVTWWPSKYIRVGSISLVTFPAPENFERKEILEACPLILFSTPGNQGVREI